MFRMVTFAVVGFLLLPQSILGQSTPQTHPVRVHLSVSGPDAVEASIRAAVARELEAHGDMVGTAVNPHWTLQIAALEMECPRGSTEALVVSVLILETFPNAPLKVLLSDKLDDPTITAIGRLTSGLFRSARHWIETAPPRDIQGLARGVVSRFRSVILRE